MFLSATAHDNSHSCGYYTSFWLKRVVVIIFFLRVRLKPFAYSTKTRSRSCRNVAVLGSKVPRLLEFRMRNSSAERGRMRHLPLARVRTLRSTFVAYDVRRTPMSRMLTFPYGFL